MAMVQVEEARKLTFEAAFAQAEKCMEALEGGTLGLEEALAMADQGKMYLMVCSEKLDAAKQRIEVRAPETADLV